MATVLMKVPPKMPRGERLFEVGTDNLVTNQVAEFCIMD